MKKALAFNGLLFSQRQTGVHRYAREVLLEMDKIVSADDNYRLVVPKGTGNVPSMKNIRVDYFGKMRGPLWEQIDFVKYLRKNDAKSVSFNNTLPILHPGMIFIHDVCYRIHPKYFTTLHGKLTVLWHRLNFRTAANSHVPIITVSYFSKNQIIDTYRVSPERIHVIGSAWQHMNSFTTDEKIIDKNHLERGKYFFTLGSISISKNTRWVYQLAKKYPKYQFVIGGSKARNDSVEFSQIGSNVLFLGFISNEEIKALEKHCRAFIFPSIYEGFGLPPLEALSQGAPIIVSNAASLPEVYRNTAHYIDPYDSNIDLDGLLGEPTDPPSEALNRYSWKNSAQKLKEIIDYWNDLK
jgi:glycosyltransferase involved in cell wall biosynthesis